MTIQNLKYVIQIAKYKSFSMAAKSLYLSQSALSISLNDLEEELGIKIFNRTNHGVTLTTEGADFLPKARQIVEESEKLLKSYQEKSSDPFKFSICSQRLAFATRAFNTLMSNIDEYSDYVFSIHEDNSTNLIKEVSEDRSEIGVATIQEGYLESALKDLTSLGLQFIEISRLPILVFVRNGHPLADKSYITEEDLLPYTCVSYDSTLSDIRLNEEVQFGAFLNKRIMSSDRSTTISLIRNNDFFALGADLPNSHFAYAKSTGVEIISIPYIDAKGVLVTGYIKRSEHSLTSLCREYIRYLTDEIQNLKSAERFANTEKYKNMLG